jgi:hypothetical protein
MVPLTGKSLRLARLLQLDGDRQLVLDQAVAGRVLRWWAKCQR